MILTQTQILKMKAFIYDDDSLNILGQENEGHDILNEAFIQEDGDGGVMTIDELQVDQGPLTIEDLNTDHVDPDEPETDDELDISFGGKKKTATKKKKTATKKKKTATKKKKTATKKKKTATKKKTAKKKTTTKKKTAKKKTTTKKKTAKKKTTTKKKKTTTKKKKTATKKKKTTNKKKGLLGIFMGGKNKKKTTYIYSSYATINLIF